MADQYKLGKELDGEAGIAYHLAAQRHHTERVESDIRARLAPLPPHIRAQVLAATDAQLDVLLGHGRKTSSITPTPNTTTAPFGRCAASPDLLHDHPSPSSGSTRWRRTA